MYKGSRHIPAVTRERWRASGIADMPLECDVAKRRAEQREPRAFMRQSEAMSHNVSEYAKPRRYFQHKLSLSDSTILPVLTFNFNKRGLGEEDSDTFENIKFIAIF